MLRQLIPIVFASLVTILPVLRKQDELILQLRQAVTQADKTNIIAAGGMRSFVFDFASPPPGSFNKTDVGFLVTAEEKTFPPLTNIPISLAVNTLAPCGMIQPHVHPRGSEFAVVVKGRLITNYIAETGAVMVENVLDAFQATLFPQGAIHASFNPECEEATSVSGFTSNDAGINFVAANFLGLDERLVLGTLGGKITRVELEGLEAANSGNPFDEEWCMKRCGLKR